MPGTKFIAKALHPTHKGQFTQYCGGHVTQACIDRGLHSPSPKIQGQAKFAKAAQGFRHKKHRK